VGLKRTPSVSMFHKAARFGVNRALANKIDFANFYKLGGMS